MRDLVEVDITEPADDAPGRMGARARRARRTATVNRNESSLTWLFARGLLDVRQVEAGERLRHDYEVAGLGPRVTMHWDMGRTDCGNGAPGPGLDPALAHLAAKHRFDAAIAAVGRGLNDVLWRVVCANEGVPAAERALGWPARAGRLVLSLALDRLGDHYRLP